MKAFLEYLHLQLVRQKDRQTPRVANCTTFSYLSLGSSLFPFKENKLNKRNRRKDYVGIVRYTVHIGMKLGQFGMQASSN